MARTSSALVEELVEVEDGLSLTPFIAVANELVTEVCGDAGYTDARLTLIETWLAAHFYTVRESVRVMERAGSVSEQRDVKTALQLQSSKYGQTAMVLDTAGGLAALSKRMEEGSVRRTVGATYLGTNPETSERDALLDE